MTDAQPSAEYDGFISYAHAADGALAPQLQAGLQRFAKPWWRRRALRVFRDESGLSANPHLWSAITAALDSSAWLVLLLSPDAARSDWVGREITHWLQTRPADRILPVLTEGDLAWDQTRNDFDPTASTAIPPALFGVFDGEPRWVDLRWAHSSDQVDLGNPRFRAAVADIASPLHGIAKDDLESEEVRQHRRTRRTAWVAAVALIALALSSLTAGAVAVRQRSVADERAAVIDAQAHESEAAQLGTLAQTVGDRDLGLLLAAAGYTMNRTPGTASNLVASLQHFGHRLFDVSVGAQVRSMVVEADGTTIDMQDHTGAPFVWSTQTQSRVASLTPGGSCCDQVALRGDGTLAVVAAQPNRSDGQVWVAGPSTGVRQWRKLPGSVITCLVGGSCNAIAWAGDRLLAMPIGPGGFIDFDVLGLIDPSGTRRTVTHRFSDQIMAFSAGTGAILAVTTSSTSSGSSTYTLHWLDPERLTELRSVETQQFDRFALSPDGTTLAATTSLGIWTGPTTATPSPQAIDPRLTTVPFGTVGEAATMAFSPDGTMLAAVSFSGALRVIRVADHRVVDAEDATDTSALAWSPDSTKVYVAGFDGHVLGFDVDPHHSLMSVLGGGLPVALHASSAARGASGVTAVGGLTSPFGVGYAAIGHLPSSRTDATIHKLPAVRAYPDLRVAALPGTDHVLVLGAGGSTVTDWDATTLKPSAVVTTGAPRGFDARHRSPDGIDPNIPFQDVVHPQSPDISSWAVFPDGAHAYYLMSAGGHQVLRGVATHPLAPVPDVVVANPDALADTRDGGRAWEPVGWTTSSSAAPNLLVLCGAHCLGELDVSTGALVRSVDTGTPVGAGEDRLSAGATGPGSSTVAVASSTGGLRFFDGHSLAAIRPWQQAAPASISAIAFIGGTASTSAAPSTSSLPSVLAVASDDGALSFWTTETDPSLDGGRLGHPLELHSPAGALLPTTAGVVAVDAAGTATEVAVGDDVWLQLACRVAGRTFTPDETARYLPWSGGSDLARTVCAT